MYYKDVFIFTFTQLTCMQGNVFIVLRCSLFLHQTIIKYLCINILISKYMKQKLY